MQIMQIEVFYMQINNKEKKNAISLFKSPRARMNE